MMLFLIALFFSASSFCFSGETPEADTTAMDMKFVLEKIYLSKPAEPLLNMLAMEALTESKKKMDAEELLKKFRETFDSHIAGFAAPYRSLFSAEEIRELKEIYSKPTYQKLSENGAQIYQNSFQALSEVFKKLVEENGEEIVALSSQVIEISKDNFSEKIARSKMPTVVVVSASWCKACKMFQPVFDDLSHQYKGKVQFAKIDYDLDGALVQRYGVNSLPTILFFKVGEDAPVVKNEGYISKKDLQEKINQFME